MTTKKEEFNLNHNRRIHPKLRMIANGDIDVNAIRAETCGSVSVTDQKVLDKLSLKRGAGAKPFTAPLDESSVRTKTLKELAKDVQVTVFVELHDPGNISMLENLNFTQNGNLFTASITLNDLEKLAGHENVAFVEPGDVLTAPQPVSTLLQPDFPDDLKRLSIEETVDRKSGDVLIGIIDVNGFDFTHQDFLNEQGETRFVAIWDQGTEIRESPAGFKYGSEFTGKILNAAIKEAAEIQVSALDLEPQSQMVEGSHGTHVASIAAGNGGVCPGVDIAAVLISLTTEDVDRRRSFYDSTRIADAVSYLMRLANKANKPLSINISLGTNGHAHDGSSALSRWIDSKLAIPGRSICVAAGNSGQEAPQSQNDWGFVMGRIHTSGRISANGLSNDIEWQVVGNSIADLSENEMEIWYEPQDRFAISIQPPGMDWIGPIEPGQFVENQELADKTRISIYNELYHPSNGLNYIAVYLSPLFNQKAVVGVRAGLWKIRLQGLDVRDGRYHGWIERDDPRKLGSLGSREAWRFPSFFSERSNIDNSSVSSLACGHRVLSVANLNEAASQVNISSSQGPTRDGRCKPDICAPGTDIIAANGFGLSSEPWIAMTGTSMASPYVAGVVGLMLKTEPRLTAAQINGIIKRTATPLPGNDYNWKNDSGFGKIDAAACVREAALVFNKEDKTS